MAENVRGSIGRFTRVNVRLLPLPGVSRSGGMKGIRDRLHNVNRHIHKIPESNTLSGRNEHHKVGECYIDSKRITKVAFAWTQNHE